MRKSVLAALLATAFLAVLTVSATVYAGSESSSGSMIGSGTMSRMSRMMDGCSAMMQGGSRSGRPNEQWRDDRSTPDRGR